MCRRPMNEEESYHSGKNLSYGTYIEFFIEYVQISHGCLFSVPLPVYSCSICKRQIEKKWSNIDGLEQMVVAQSVSCAASAIGASSPVPVTMLRSLPPREHTSKVRYKNILCGIILCIVSDKCFRPIEQERKLKIRKKKLVMEGLQWADRIIHKPKPWTAQYT